jgi:hypothetical protein
MFWFYHQYQDEARRFRVFRIEIASEAEARNRHRQACDFHWVTDHVKPAVSPLFTRGEHGVRTLIPGHRQGETYSTEYRPIACPPEVSARVAGLRMPDVEALY